MSSLSKEPQMKWDEVDCRYLENIPLSELMIKYGSDAFLVYDDWYDNTDVHLAFKRLETPTEIDLRVKAAKLTIKTKRIQKLDTKRKEEKEKNKRFELFQKLKEEFENDG